MNVIRTCAAKAIAIGICLIAVMPPIEEGRAAALAGLRTLKLVSPDGNKTTIGHVSLTAKENGYDFEVMYDRSAFTERYMEETNFLCLPGSKGDICQFPYPPGEYAPNDSAGHIENSDLRPLEYALLFAERRASEVDINPFNGLFYRLEIASDHLEGHLYAADFRRLIGASQAANYPLAYDDLDAVDVSESRYPVLVIE